MSSLDDEMRAGLEAEEAIYRRDRFEFQEHMQQMRGKARVKVRARAKTPRPIEWLFSPNLPNELCWRVLEYWNPRSGAAHFEGLLRCNPDAQREVAAAAGPAPALP